MTLSDPLPDYYAILGVFRSATEDEIRRAYRRMARLVHPDRGPKSPDLPDIRLVNEAWDVLGDPAARAIYDRATEPESEGSSENPWLNMPHLPRVPKGFDLHPRPRPFGSSFGARHRLADMRHAALSLYALGTDLSGLLHLPDDGLWLLDLQGLPLNDSDLRFLARFQTLRVLLCDDATIGDAGLEWLRPLSALHTLSLTACKVTDQGMPTLRAIESLEVLELDETCVTDEGLAALEGHPELMVLDLRRTKVRGDGLRHLVDLPELRELRVTGRADRVARRLFADRPGFVIE